MVKLKGAGLTPVGGGVGKNTRKGMLYERVNVCVCIYTNYHSLYKILQSIFYYIILSFIFTLILLPCVLCAIVTALLQYSFLSLSY